MNDGSPELEKNIVQLQQLDRVEEQGHGRTAGGCRVPAAVHDTAHARGNPRRQRHPKRPSPALLRRRFAEPQAQPVELSPAEPAAAAEAAAPAKPDVPVPPAPALRHRVSSTRSSNPLNLAAGGGLPALLLAGAFTASASQRNRPVIRRAALQPSFGSVAPRSSAPAVVGSVDTGSSIIQTDFSQSGMTSIDAGRRLIRSPRPTVPWPTGVMLQAEEIPRCDQGGSGRTAVAPCCSRSMRNARASSNSTIPHGTLLPDSGGRVPTGEGGVHGASLTSPLP